jgi:hypothetical protein
MPWNIISSLFKVEDYQLIYFNLYRLNDYMVEVSVFSSFLLIGFILIGLILMMNLASILTYIKVSYYKQS